MIPVGCGFPLCSQWNYGNEMLWGGHSTCDFRVLYGLFAQLACFNCVPLLHIPQRLVFRTLDFICLMGAGQVEEGGVVRHPWELCQSQWSILETMAWVTHSVSQGLSWLAHPVWHWSHPSASRVFHTFLSTNVHAILPFYLTQEKTLLLKETRKDVYRRAHACLGCPWGGPFSSRSVPSPTL